MNLEPQVYSALLTLARKDDVPLAQIIRRAVNELVARQVTADMQPELPISRSGQAAAAGMGR